jgi:adenylate cyclase
MAQRRLAAILSLDMVGYSRLVGMDETGTILRQKTCRTEVIDPVIARHGGRIVNTAGDGVLAEFVSAVDAVECAVGIQRSIDDREPDVAEDRRIRFRIGINLGDIIIDGDDILGDGVNVAARLETLSEPGGIAIAGSVYDQILDKLDFDFVDDGEHEAKNIRRPIRVWRWVSESAGIAPAGDGQAGRDAFDRPAIAVLPFQNLSGDPDQEYFADGLAEDLITALSCMHSIPVIARNSSFSYKGQTVRVRDVAKELGARYLLEGSVRKAGGRVRVSVQLVDGDTGHHLWANRYDRPLDDVFAIQDDITLRVAIALQVELTEAELRKQSAQRTGSLSAWDHFLRGMSQLHRDRCDENELARGSFRAALEIDPAYGEAWAGLGWSHLNDYALKCADDVEASLESGYDAARKGVALDEGSALTHYVLSTAYVWREQLPLSFEELRRVLELNPYFARAHLALGNRLDLAGQPDDGIAGLRRALELNPRDPNRPQYMLFLARALTVQGAHDEALRWAASAVGLDLDNPDVQYRYAICLANLDRADEARAALARCEQLRPDFILKRRNWRPYSDDSRNDRFFAGMRRNGLMQ